MTKKEPLNRWNDSARRSIPITDRTLINLGQIDKERRGFRGGQWAEYFDSGVSGQLQELFNGRFDIKGVLPTKEI